MTTRVSVVSLLVLSICAFSAPAENVTFTNTAANSSWSQSAFPLWGETVNWTNSAGANPLVVPTNGEDVVLSEPASNVSRTAVFTGKLYGQDGGTYITGTTSVNPTIGSLTGGRKWVIRHGAPADKWGHWKNRPFTVSDPNGFAGYWEPGQHGCGILLPVAPGSEKTPRLESFYSGLRGAVNVTNAGAKAEIGDLYGRGTLQKEGRGELVVEGSDGEDTDIIVANGTITLNGRSDDGEDTIGSLLDMSAVHLDASVAGTLLTTNAGPGTYSYVTNWADVRGNGYSAVAPTYARPGTDWAMGFTIPGYVAPEKSPTGLGLVSFGSPAARANVGYDPIFDEAFGPTNCCLELAYNGKMTALSGIKEVFYAVIYARCARYATLFSHNDTWLTFLSDTWWMFSGAYAYTWRITEGEFRKNGELWAPDQYDYTVLNTMTNMMVCSVALAGDTIISHLGTDRHYMSRSGGTRFGEVLFFTNSLTRVQRQRINAYLYGKWVSGGMAGGTCEYEAGNVILRKGASIGVPSGRVARARNIVASASPIVKTGGGVLEVDNVLGTNVSFSVQGGSVRFMGNPEAVSAAEPAADPFIWVDASRSDTLTTTTDPLVPGKTFVTEWRDCRAGVNVKATAIGTVDAPGIWTVPTVGDAGGKPTVDFGSLWAAATASNRAAMKFSRDYSARVAYAAFAAIRPLGITTMSFFGSSQVDTFRSSSRDYILGNYLPVPQAASATWTLNGVPVDVYEPRAGLNDTNAIIVVAVSADEPLMIDGLCHCGANAQSRGGMQIAEEIVYHRPLSEKERRDTEAYLMAKWLGETHPETREGSAAPTMSFPSSSPVSIGTASSVASADVVFVEGGNGTLVKTGDGGLSLGAYTNGVRNLRVEGGTLTAALGFSPSAISLFHFDANDRDSLYTYDEVGTDGVARAFVTCWRDTRRNGTWAKPAKDFDPHPSWSRAMYSATNPVLKSVETAAGVVRSVVDFGQGRHFYATSKHEAPMYDEAPMLWNRSYNAAEVHTIAADHATTYNPVGSSYIAPRGRIVSCGGGASCHFYRSYLSSGNEMWTWQQGAGAKWNSLTFSTVEGEAYTWLDNVLTNAATAFPSGFHLVGAATSNAVPGLVDAFACDRDCSGGGVLIGEQIGFDRWLTDKERTYLTSHLMRKWFGENAADRVVWTNSLDSVYVAPGAAFVESGEAVMATPSFAGGGSVTVEELLGVSSFTLEGPLSVNGTLAVADGAISLDVDAGFDLTVPGIYTVISATSLEGVDLSRWTLGGRAVSSRRVTSLVAGGDGRSVCVKVEAKGLQIVVD